MKLKINADLEKFITNLMNTAKTAPLEDQLKIVDRALKLEALKMKVRSAEMGSAFGGDTGGSEDDE